MPRVRNIKRAKVGNKMLSIGRITKVTKEYAEQLIKAGTHERVHGNTKTKEDRAIEKIQEED